MNLLVLFAAVSVIPAVSFALIPPDGYNDVDSNGAGVTELFSYNVFGGLQKGFSHFSHETKCVMKFTIFLPPNVANGTAKAPVLYFLPGMTADEKSVLFYTLFHYHAVKYNLIVVSPDTSPRGLHLPGEGKSKQYGEGAGWYVDATQAPWKDHYRMSSYVTKELPTLIEKEFFKYVVTGKKSIMGHSMGGHGALILSMRNPGMYRSSTAFAPMCNPSALPPLLFAPFKEYFGENQTLWREWDATYLIQKYKGPDLHFLVDQGTDDKLLPVLGDWNFTQAAKKANVSVNFRLQPGYNHIFIVPGFIGDHIKLHAEALAN